MNWKTVSLALILLLPLAGCATESSAPTLAPNAKSMAIDGIKGYSGVRDAAINQDGKKLSLVIIVGYATSEDYSKEMGDNFVRMVKSFSQEPSPGKEIGKGDYDYLVGVYYPDETLVVMGAKASSSDHITW